MRVRGMKFYFMYCTLYNSAKQKAIQVSIPRIYTCFIALFIRIIIFDINLNWKMSLLVVVVRYNRNNYRHVFMSNKAFMVTSTKYVIDLSDIQDKTLPVITQLYHGTFMHLLPRKGYMTRLKPSQTSTGFR